MSVVRIRLSSRQVQWQATMHYDLRYQENSQSQSNEEDQIFAEIERMVGEEKSEVRQMDNFAGATPGNSGRRRHFLLLYSVIALVAALVPAGLKKSDLLVKATHQETRN